MADVGVPPSAARDRHAARTFSPAVVTGGLLLGVVAVSSAAILVRIAAAPAIALSFWRTFGGAAVLGPFGLRNRRGLPPLQGSTRWAIVASGLFLALHFALFIGSISFTTVASAVTLATASPLFVALGSARFLGEPPSRRTWIGLALALFGALAIGFADASDLELAGRALLGDAMAFGSALAVAGYLLIGRRLRATLPNSVYAGGVYATSAVALAVTALIGSVPLLGFSTKTWLAIAALTIGPQLLGHTIFNALLSTVTPVVVSIVVLAEPVVSTLLAWWLLAELPTPLFWIGAPFIFAGVLIATTDPDRA